jgi:hypothetical protein
MIVFSQNKLRWKNFSQGNEFGATGIPDWYSETSKPDQDHIVLKHFSVFAGQAPPQPKAVQTWLTVSQFETKLQILQL